MTTHSTPLPTAIALLAALLLAAPAAASDLPRSGSALPAFPPPSPIVDDAARAMSHVPGYRGLTPQDFDDYEFAVPSGVLAGVGTVLGVVFAAYADQSDDPGWAVSAGFAWGVAGTFGTTGAVVGAKVETHRERALLQLPTDPDGPVDAVQVGPTRLTLRF